MARRSSRHPTESELEILNILWRRGPLPVREVRDALDRPLAYTSVMTVMNIMVDKGYLARCKDVGIFVYLERIGLKATTRRMLGDLVDRAFDGSPAAVMINLLESADLDQAEIEKLRELLDRRHGEGKS